MERDKFPWPDTEEQAKEVTAEQLKMLLAGIDFWHAHEELYFEEMN